jgi:RimJ/RimL family protein N-acetyltransferase
VELRRLALSQTGTGQGAVFLDALIDYSFTNLAAKRLWLDASGENLRAQRVYTRAGFTFEGRLRQHWYRPSLGRTVDVMLYGMMRDEWQPPSQPLAAPLP